MTPIIVDKVSLNRFIKSAEKHTQVVEKLFSKGTCAIGTELADEFTRFERSVEVFKSKNKLP